MGSYLPIRIAVKDFGNHNVGVRQYSRNILSQRRCNGVSCELKLSNRQRGEKLSDGRNVRNTALTSSNCVRRVRRRGLVVLRHFHDTATTTSRLQANDPIGPENFQ